MRIELDPESEVPLYQQIRDRVVEGIAAGALEPGEALASVRQLALAFGINVATVGKGYELLRREALVRTNHKSGSVIARGPADGEPADAFVADWRARVTTLLAEGYAQGLSADRIRGVVDLELAAFTARAPADAGERGARP